MVNIVVGIVNRLLQRGDNWRVTGNACTPANVRSVRTESGGVRTGAGAVFHEVPDPKAPNTTDAGRALILDKDDERVAVRRRAYILI